LSRGLKNLLKIALCFVFQSYPQLTISLLYQESLSRATLYLSTAHKIKNSY